MRINRLIQFQVEVIHCPGREPEQARRSFGDHTVQGSLSALGAPGRDPITADLSGATVEARA